MCAGLGGERGFEPCALTSGEPVAPGAQDVPDLVQGLTPTSSVAQGVLLDAAAHFVERATGDLDDMEGTRHDGGVAGLVIDDTLRLWNGVSRRNCNAFAELLFACAQPVFVDSGGPVWQQVQQPGRGMMPPRVGDARSSLNVFRRQSWWHHTSSSPPVDVPARTAARGFAWEERRGSAAAPGSPARTPGLPRDGSPPGGGFGPVPAPIAAPSPGDRIAIQVVTGGRRWAPVTRRQRRPLLRFARAHRACGRDGPTGGPSHLPAACVSSPPNVVSSCLTISACFFSLRVTFAANTAAEATMIARGT